MNKVLSFSNLQSILKKFTVKKPEGFVSINLGNYYIKGLIIEDNKIKDYFLERNDGLSTILGSLWQKKKISANKVKVSIKNPSSLVRYFNFPKMEKKKMKQALFYELNKYIPFSPEEVYFDFCVLGEVNPKEVYLMLAVAKKDFIDKTLGAFEKQNLDVLEIGLDSVCLTNHFLDTYKEEKTINACMLDIGYSFSTLTILKKGMPFLTRDLEFSAKDIFQVISRIKNLKPEDIEKWLFSLKDHNEFLELAKNSISSLCQEIKSSFDYFEVNTGERIEKMYLTGGIVSVKGIEGAFKDNLEMEVAILDNLTSLDISFSDDKFNKCRNSFSVAFGLIV
jgi:type IV pilus assembly protein PilM